MSLSKLIFSTLLLAFGAAPTWSATAPATPALQFSPCQIGAPDSPQHLEARCTTLVVPEDRAKPDGKKVGLHIALLRARAGEPAPDPLFFIAGGPGEAFAASNLALLLTLVQHLSSL